MNSEINDYQRLNFSSEQSIVIILALKVNLLFNIENVKNLNFCISYQKIFMLTSFLSSFHVLPKSDET